MFAIVDVETTGSHARGNGLTEIAIVLHDGVNVGKEYSTLLNPQQGIPQNIQALTGITPSMVADAPTFAEKAHEIRDFLGEAIFVAHNVNFDYAFVKSAFASCGIDYNPKRLCSVRYARRVEKGLKSYSLSNLCKHFKLKNEAAHRAWGDARATAKILELLLDKDTSGQWQYLINKASGEINLPANLPGDEYKALPEAPGVYYFLDKNGKPIYIGKAKNLKKRVATHFSSNKESKRSQGFKREIYHVDFERTGSELLASLLEDHEIRHHWPIYNLAQKKPKKRYGLFAYQNVKGNWRFAVNQLTKQQGFIAEFYSLQEAQSRAMQLAKEHQLNHAYCGFPLYKDELQITDEEHNTRFAVMLHELQEQEANFLIKTKGRTQDEEGFAFINDSNLEGIGFVPKEADVQTIEDVLPYVRKIGNSVTTRGVINKALTQNTYEIISL